MSVFPALFPAALLAAAEHDVRGMLVTLELGTKALGGEGLDGPAGAAAEVVARTTSALATTLEELIATAAGIVEGELTVAVVDLDRLLGEVAAYHGVTAHLTPDGPPRMVEGNAVVIRHLLLNLVANATAASGPDSVMVWTELHQGGGVQLVVTNPVVAEARPDRGGAVGGSGQLLHLDRGRGLAIVRILADAAGVVHDHDVEDGLFVARLVFPNRIDHPSAGEAGGIGRSSHGVVVDLHEGRPGRSSVTSDDDPGGRS